MFHFVKHQSNQLNKITCNKFISKLLHLWITNKTFPGFETIIFHTIFFGKFHKQHQLLNMTFSLKLHTYRIQVQTLLSFETVQSSISSKPSYWFWIESIVKAFQFICTIQLSNSNHYFSTFVFFQFHIIVNNQTLTLDRSHRSYVLDTFFTHMTKYWRISWNFLSSIQTNLSRVDVESNMFPFNLRLYIHRKNITTFNCKQDFIQSSFNSIDYEFNLRLFLQLFLSSNCTSSNLQQILHEISLRFDYHLKECSFR